MYRLNSLTIRTRSIDSRSSPAYTAACNRLMEHPAASKIHAANSFPVFWRIPDVFPSVPCLRCPALVRCHFFRGASLPVCCVHLRGSWPSHCSISNCARWPCAHCPLLGCAGLPGITRKTSRMPFASGTGSLRSAISSFHSHEFLGYPQSMGLLRP